MDRYERMILPLDMTCSDFLESYSDFRDGLIDDPGLARRLADHLAVCPRCMQYDARVARAATLLRSFSDIEPSPRFRYELSQRLNRSHLTLEEPVRPAPAGIMVGLMVATAIALVVWTTGEHQVTPASSVETAAVPATPSPPPAVVALPSPPFVSFTELSAPAFEAEWRTPGAGDETLASWTGAVP